MVPLVPRRTASALSIDPAVATTKKVGGTMMVMLLLLGLALGSVGPCAAPEALVSHGSRATAVE